MIMERNDLNTPINDAWVSFCITTYKRPFFLKKQIGSLLQQTFSDFKIIISDNDSTSNNKDIVDSFNDSRIEYYVNEHNLGMVKSFNKSLARAKSEYVVMITDDDLVYPYMLQTLYDLTIHFPDFGMYYGSYDRFYMNAETAEINRSKVGTNSQLARLDFGSIRKFSVMEFPLAFFQEDFGGGIFWSTGIVRRKIALAIGGIADYGSPNMIDCAFVLSAGSQQGAVFINQSLGYQTIHEENYSFKDSNFANFSKGTIGFYEWSKQKIPQNVFNDNLDKKIKNFTGRMLVSFFIFVKRNIKLAKLNNESFNKCLDETFQISFMRKWRIKYLIAVHLPLLFSLLLTLKKKVFK